MPIPVVVRKKKTPVVVVKKEEKEAKPSSPKRKEPPKPEKPKGPAPIDKVQQHQKFLSELDAMTSPEREVARACYFLCFLINEKESTTPLFSLKDQVLKKIFDSERDSLIVSYVRRGDKLIFRLTPEAKAKWEAETGGKKGLIHLYRSPGCYVQSERGYYDLYQFHIVVEPFRFMFDIPVELAPWITEERITKPRIRSPVVTECGLLRGQKIKMSKKSSGVTDDEIRRELQSFLEADGT